MSDQTPNEEKKIIVDEDWKGRVQAEKEAAEKEAAEKEATAKEPPKAAEQPAEQPAGQTTPQLPPPDLTFLAGTLYMQGLFALGLLPGPEENKPKLDIPRAKHAIDTLAVLQEKTEGNRTPEESKEMEQMLHELRMAFISVQQGGAPGVV